MSDYAFETASEYEYKSPEPKVIGRYTLPSAKELERIISQCLSAQIKREDAPCSSETHLNSAIAALSNLIPDYNPDNEEMRQALEWARDEGKILRGEK
jgi:hypothetical protein